METIAVKYPSIVIFVVLLASTIQVTFSLQDEQTCSSETLEECTKNLLRYTSDEVKVPETEQEVKDNCA